ncbi:MAG TPA: hypothetical protein VKL40_06275 [Candidatus Angelobacter sp.]|nr:hypothetical protein [Candidatus Angelobacter sp.]
MMTRHQGPIPEPVAQLQQELNQWRSTNRPRTRLPEPFWNAAVELARQYGIYQTANPLRLDYVGLKKRLVGLQNTQRKPRAKRTKAAFVEFVAPHTAKPDEWVIEFESSRGSKMRIQGKAATPLDWPALLRAWHEVEP